MSANSKGRIVHLDGARGLAAMLVVAEHLRSFLFKEFHQLDHSSMPLRAFYFATGLGHQAVVVFFVLSGFFVAGGVYERRAQWNWRRYTIMRLSRLWVVLLPSLLLTLFWIQAGTALSLRYYIAPSVAQTYLSAPRVFPFPLGFGDFAGNLFFLQTILVPCYGDDGPLWSLANEFWYYVCFPLLFFGLGGGIQRSAMRMAYLAMAIVVMTMLPRSILEGFVVWMMGFLAYLAIRQPIARRLAESRGVKIALFASFCAVLVWSRTASALQPIPDLALGIAFSCVLICLVCMPAPRGLYARVCVHISDFSYTLYLAHFSFLAFIVAAVLDDRLLAPSIGNLACFPLLFSLACLYAYVIYLAFERRTDYFRLQVTSACAAVGRQFHLVAAARRSSQRASGSE